MFCQNCGTQLPETANVCSNCGRPVRGGETVTVKSSGDAIDKGGFPWGLLGFCVPIAGLVLYLVWKGERPKTAKAAGLGALISLICGILIYVVYFLIVVVFMVMV